MDTIYVTSPSSFSFSIATIFLLHIGKKIYDIKTTELDAKGFIKDKNDSYIEFFFRKVYSYKKFIIPNIILAIYGVLPVDNFCGKCSRRKFFGNWISTNGHFLIGQMKKLANSVIMPNILDLRSPTRFPLRPSIIWTFLDATSF